VGKYCKKGGGGWEKIQKKGKRKRSAIKMIYGAGGGGKRGNNNHLEMSSIGGDRVQGEGLIRETRRAGAKAKADALEDHQRKGG